MKNRYVNSKLKLPAASCGESPNVRSFLFIIYALYAFSNVPNSFDF